MNRNLSGYLATLDLGLTPEERETYKESFSDAFSSFSQIQAYYQKVLTSDDYSFNLKQKLAFAKSYLTESLLWGVKNLEGEDLLFFVQQTASNRLVLLLVAEQRITFELAEVITQIWCSQKPSVPPSRVDLDIAPILEWARETYNLDASIPDSWVRQFLSGNRVEEPVS